MQQALLYKKFGNENWQYEVKLGLVYLTAYIGPKVSVLEVPKKIDKRIVYSIEEFCFFYDFLLKKLFTCILFRDKVFLTKDF